MVRPRVRPPPIDVVAATSAMSPNSYSPSPSPVSSATSILTNLHKTGLIQILPPPPEMDEDDDSVLHYSSSTEDDSSSSQSSSPFSYINSNRHMTPPQSLPSSPTFTVSPISPTFAGLTHITFADSGFDNVDPDSFTFIPVTWISSTHIGDDEAYFLCAGYSKGERRSKGKEPEAFTSTSPSHSLSRKISRRPTFSSSSLDWPPPPSPILPCSPFQSYSPFPSPVPSPRRQGFCGDYLTAGDFSSFLSGNLSPSLDRPRSGGLAYHRAQGLRSSRSRVESLQDENEAPYRIQTNEDVTRGRTAQRQSRLWNRRARIVS